MIAFKVEINGEKICTAGIESTFGVLTSILSWAKRDVSQLSVEVRKAVPEEELKLTVAGNAIYEKGDVNNVQWVGRNLEPGDQIKIHILETNEVDKPIKSKRSAPGV